MADITQKSEALQIERDSNLKPLRVSNLDQTIFGTLHFRRTKSVLVGGSIKTGEPDDHSTILFLRDLMLIGSSPGGREAMTEFCNRLVILRRTACLKLSNRPMLCELCNQTSATFHLTLIQNGKMKRVNVCDPCARVRGLDNPNSAGANASWPDLLVELSATQEKKRSALAQQVEQIVNSTGVYDVHTHLYDRAFGSLLLWGIDDLLTYHYLVAEVFRHLDLPYQKFWSLTKTEQADLIWDTLFLQLSPISEACRGVVTTLQAHGLDVKKRDLGAIRKWFASWKVDDYITHCMQLGGVKTISMTNSPFDEEERPVWERGFERDERFAAALRIDPLVLDWPMSAPRLKQWGYDVTPELSESTVSEARRFLADWSNRIQAKYLMVSLPPSFAFPEESLTSQVIEKIVLPHCREFGLPFALMLGVKRAVNPGLRLAGDGMGLSNLQALENLCARYPDNKFLTTVLARENQHELCVLARKFRNLHIFGCWWFTNVPYVVEEMTRMRIELLGLSCTPQHSDARVLDQLVYKWQHSRKIIAGVLVEKYADLAEAGWEATQTEIERDVKELLGGGFERFCKR